MKGVCNDPTTGKDVDFALPLLYQPFSNVYEYPAVRVNWEGAVLIHENLDCESSKSTPNATRV
jgi:hypothetical protein